MSATCKASTLLLYFESHSLRFLATLEKTSAPLISREISHLYPAPSHTEARHGGDGRSPTLGMQLGQAQFWPTVPLCCSPSQASHSEFFLHSNVACLLLSPDPRDGDTRAHAEDGFYGAGGSMQGKPVLTGDPPLLEGPREFTEYSSAGSTLATPQSSGAPIPTLPFRMLCLHYSSPSQAACPDQPTLSLFLFLFLS